jgi:hypothetical protein
VFFSQRCDGLEHSKRDMPARVCRLRRVVFRTLRSPPTTSALQSQYPSGTHSEFA